MSTVPFDPLSRLHSQPWSSLAGLVSVALALFVLPDLLGLDAARGESAA